MALFGNAKRQYQKEWIAARKAEGFKYLGGKCVECGTRSDLTIDHKNPKTKDSALRKYKTGAFWSWSWERVLAELDKCQLLCEMHHKAKTLQNKEAPRGSANGRSKLTEKQVLEIRTKYATGNYSHRSLAKEYEIKSVSTIGKILRNETWVDLI